MIPSEPVPWLEKQGAQCPERVTTWSCHGE
jgi:hypothetical protein